MANELILIIEDNEKNAKLMRDVLQFQGYRTLEAETGVAGVALALQHLPDLILMDYQLPDINGIEAFERIRGNETARHIPILAVTASAMPADVQRMMDAGFDGYQSKPISVKDFVRAVAETLGARKGA